MLMPFTIDNRGRVPLHYAVRSCSPSDNSSSPAIILCRTLLEFVPHTVHIADKDGIQALHLAVASASQEAVALLIRNGADPGARDNMRRSILRKLAISNCFSGKPKLLNSRVTCWWWILSSQIGLLFGET